MEVAVGVRVCFWACGGGWEWRWGFVRKWVGAGAGGRVGEEVGVRIAVKLVRHD